MPTSSELSIHAAVASDSIHICCVPFNFLYDSVHGKVPFELFEAYTAGPNGVHIFAPPGTIWQTRSDNPTQYMNIDTTHFSTFGFAGQHTSHFYYRISFLADKWQRDTLHNGSIISSNSCLQLLPPNSGREQLAREFGFLAKELNLKPVEVEAALRCLFVSMPLQYLELSSDTVTNTIRDWIAHKTHQRALAFTPNQQMERVSAKTGTVKFWLPREATATISLHPPSYTISVPAARNIATDTLLAAGDHAIPFNLPANFSLSSKWTIRLVADGWHVRTWPLGQ